MHSWAMKAALTYPEMDGSNTVNTSSCKGFGDGMKAIFSDVGDLQKTSDKLMFELISIKFPQNYDEDL